MSTVIADTIRINAPIDQVWEAVSDFGNIKRFHPALKDSYSTSEVNGGVGATRHCDLAPMGSIEERVIDWIEGVGYRVEIYDTQNLPPVKEMFGEFRLETDSDGTIAHFQIEYEPKLGSLGVLMNNVVLRSQFQKTVGKVLLGLKHHVETGELMSRDVFKRIQAIA